MKPLGMSQEEISRTEFWRALKPDTKRILDIWFAEPERTLAESVSIYRNRTSMITPVVDEHAMRTAEKLLQDPNVQAVIELRNARHASQKEVL